MSRSLDKVRLRKYLRELDQLIGAKTTGAPNPASDYDASFGPLSPEQLAKLDRALTPAEQKAVEDWQASQSDAQLAAERAKGGPQSATVSVTEKGAVIKSLAKPTKPMVAATSGHPWWQWALLVGGLLGLAGGTALLVTTPKTRRRYA